MKKIYIPYSDFGQFQKMRKHLEKIYKDKIQIFDSSSPEDYKVDIFFCDATSVAFNRVNLEKIIENNPDCKIIAIVCFNLYSDEAKENPLINAVFNFNDPSLLKEIEDWVGSNI